MGEAEVIDEGGTLVIALGPNGARRFPLIHFDRDTFLFVPAPETPALKLPVFFTIGQGQQAIELQMGMIGGNSQSHMRRVQ